MMKSLQNPLGRFIVLALAFILSPLIVVWVVAYGIYTVLLYLLVWISWCRKGPRVLVVYSRSPHWQDRFESYLIPQLPTSSIVINWSDRKQWSRYSLRTRVFNCFLGSFAHTPSVIVFRPFHRARIFRFFEAYKSFRHGNPAPVLEMEAALLKAVRSDN